MYDLGTQLSEIQYIQALRTCVRPGLSTRYTDAGSGWKSGRGVLGTGRGASGCPAAGLHPPSCRSNTAFMLAKSKSPAPAHHFMTINKSQLLIFCHSEHGILNQMKYTISSIVKRSALFTVTDFLNSSVI